MKTHHVKWYLDFVGRPLAMQHIKFISVNKELRLDTPKNSDSDTSKLNYYWFTTSFDRGIL